jgi:hypothetical protein
MLNANNIRPVRYKTEKVTTMDSITQIVLSHIRCPHPMHAQGLSLVPLHAVDNIYGQWNVSCGSRKENN